LSIKIVQQTIASLFKRKSSEVIPAKQLELLASMELRWFDPKDARALVDHAVSVGLLEMTENGLKTTFDLQALEIPMGFKPPKDLVESLEDEDNSLFIQLVNQISITSGMESEDIIANINEMQENAKNFFTIETLAILYGKELGIDMDRFIPEVKSKLLSGGSSEG
jgi:hypothetical protein